MKRGDIYMLEIKGELTHTKLVPSLILSKIQNNIAMVVRINTKIPDQSKLQNIVVIGPTIPIFPHPSYIDFRNTMSVHTSRLKTKIGELNQDLVELVIKEITNAILPLKERDLKNKAIEILKDTPSKDIDTLLSQPHPSEDKIYDIFLSHSIKDDKLILSLKDKIESLGYSVYIDWIEDESLKRYNVTKETAEKLKNRMKNCRCLLVVASINSALSKWVPWELGFFDGLKGKVAVLPIEADDKDITFKGREYLKLYKNVQSSALENRKGLYIQNNNYDYIHLNEWISEN